MLILWRAMGGFMVWGVMGGGVMTGIRYFLW